MARKSKAIHLDLKVGLPVIRKAFEANKLQMQKTGYMITGCSYRGGCAIGQLLTDAERRRLDSRESSNITSLIDTGDVVVPEGQEEDFAALQASHDRGFPSNFQRTLEYLEATYLSEPVA